MLIYEQRLWSTTLSLQRGRRRGILRHARARCFSANAANCEIRGERNAPKEIKLQHSVQPLVADNQRNWIDCIKSGDEPHAAVEIAHRTATAIHLSNLATRLNRTLHFDPQREVVVDDEEANSQLGRVYREGGHWSVPQPV